MRFIIQRVQHASVTVDQQKIGNIGKGYLVLIGVSGTDTKEIADKMIRKMIGLRIFDDENGKTNLDLNTVNGELLLVSQFTLYADCKKGNRPSFINAGAPDMAKELYEYIISECAKQVPVVQHGIFGADMKVELLNDGPIYHLSGFRYALIGVKEEKSIYRINISFSAKVVIKLKDQEALTYGQGFYLLQG